MNKEQLNNLKNKIEDQKKELEDSELIYSIYEKINYIKEHFPENCLLRMMTSHSEGRMKLSFISSWIGEKHILLDSSNFIRDGIDIYFPKGVKVEDKTFVFKNTDKSIDEFIKDLLGNKYDVFQYLYLDETLSVNQKEVKKLKL